MNKFKLNISTLKLVVSKYASSIIWQLWALYVVGANLQQNSSIALIYASEYIRSSSEPLVLILMHRLKLARISLLRLASVFALFLFIIFGIIFQCGIGLTLTTVVLAIAPSVAALMANKLSDESSRRKNVELKGLFNAVLYVVVATMANRISVYYYGLVSNEKNIDFLQVERNLQLLGNIMVTYINYSAIFGKRGEKVEFGFFFLVIPFFLFFPAYWLLYLVMVVKWMSSSFLIKYLERDRMIILSLINIAAISSYAFMVEIRIIDDLTKSLLYELMIAFLMFYYLKKCCRKFN